MAVFVVSATPKHTGRVELRGVAVRTALTDDGDDDDGRQRRVADARAPPHNDVRCVMHRHERLERAARVPPGPTPPRNRYGADRAISRRGSGSPVSEPAYGGDDGIYVNESEEVLQATTYG